VCNWGGDPSNIIDKHSTGGVGDKTSLLLVPLGILEGLRVPMIAGRGLGHTGGTLDKLESIPGMNVYLPAEKMKRLMAENNAVFMGQTDEIAPLDKRLYAMRDVTDTVESIPLITASILSKKLSEGLGGLVMDVKFGNGAFMVEIDDALRLAQSIAAVGTASGVKTRCLLTDMNSPLGDRAGNALEVEECIEIFHGKGPRSTIDLTLELAVEMVLLHEPARDRSDLRSNLVGHLSSGRAFEKFCQVVRAQGGDTRVLENPNLLPKATYKLPVPAAKGGFVAECDVRALGLSVIELGGGRKRSSDQIDLAVGLSGLKRVGDRIAEGEPLGFVHANEKALGTMVVRKIEAAYRISESADRNPLVWRMI
jgi:thymidine phosphorylase